MFTGLEQAFHISHYILNTIGLKCRDFIIVHFAFVCLLYEEQIGDSGITVNIHCLFQVYGMNVELCHLRANWGRSGVFEENIYIFLSLLFYYKCKWILPGGSGNAIRHNTQNNPPGSSKAQHTELHNNKEHILYTMDTITIQPEACNVLIEKKSLGWELNNLCTSIRVLVG
jgi:hypothetical protein